MIEDRPDIDPKGRYSVAQAAKALGVSDTTVRRWHKSGALRHDERASGASVRFRGKDLLAFWEKH